MRKYISLFIILCFCFSLISCNQVGEEASGETGESENVRYKNVYLLNNKRKFITVSDYDELRFHFSSKANEENSEIQFERNRNCAEFELLVDRYTKDPTTIMMPYFNGKLAEQALYPEGITTPTGRRESEITIKTHDDTFLLPSISMYAKYGERNVQITLIPLREAAYDTLNSPEFDMVDILTSVAPNLGNLEHAREATSESNKYQTSVKMADRQTFALISKYRFEAEAYIYYDGYIVHVDGYRSTIEDEDFWSGFSLGPLM